MRFQGSDKLSGTVFYQHDPICGLVNALELEKAAGRQGQLAILENGNNSYRFGNRSTQSEKEAKTRKSSTT